MSDQDFRIIPERDDNRGATRATSTASGKSEKNAAPRNGDESGRASRPTGSGTGSGKSGIVLALVALVLAGFLAYQWQVQVGMNRDFEKRVLELEQQLDVTDESVTASGAALQNALRDHADQLELHMSEIRKLWDLSNKTNKPNIESNTASIAALEKELKGVAAIASGLQGMRAIVEQLQSESTASRSAVESASSRIIVFSAQLDDLMGQLNAARSSLSKLESAVNTMNGRTVEHDQALQSIDAFRRDTNEKILSLQQRLTP